MNGSVTFFFNIKQPLLLLAVINNSNLKRKEKFAINSANSVLSKLTALIALICQHVGFDGLNINRLAV